MSSSKLSPTMIALIWDLKRSPRYMHGITRTLKSLNSRGMIEYRSDGLYGLSERAVLWCADQIRTAEYYAYADDAWETRQADARYAAKVNACSNVVTGTPDELIAILHGAVAIERETVWCEKHDGAHFFVRDECVFPHLTDQATRARLNREALERNINDLELTTVALLGDCGHAYTTPDGTTHFCAKPGGHPIGADHEDATMVWPHVTDIVVRAMRSEVYDRLPVADAWTLAIAEDGTYGTRCSFGDLHCDCDTVA